MQKRILLPLAWIAIGLLVTACDFLTGPNFQFSYLFTIPVSLASWYNGRRLGLLFAIAMPSFQTLYFLHVWEGEFNTLAIAANLMTQVSVFAAISELTHRVALTRRLRSQILRNIPVGLWVLDQDGKLIHSNLEGLSIWGGYPFGNPEDREGPQLLRLDNGEPIPQKERPAFQSLRHGVSVKNEIFGIERWDGSRRIIQASSVPVMDEHGRIEGAVVVNQDITEAKRLEKEREEMYRSLEDATRNIKVLSGLLPICASCKKIRDNRGGWQEMERYIRSHSEAEFSHGICPDCLDRHYPEYADSVKAS